LQLLVQLPHLWRHADFLHEMLKVMSLTKETSSQTTNSVQSNGFQVVRLTVTWAAILAESLAEIPASRFHVVSKVLRVAAASLQNDHCLGNLG